MADTEDTNVEKVCEKLAYRSRKGVVNYGTTTADAGLSQYQWLQHLQEELMDACVYIEAFLNNHESE